MSRLRGTAQQPKMRRVKDMSADLNVIAIQEGPQKKKWTLHDLRQLEPLTEKQREFFVKYYEDFNIVAYGCAGTGKTLLALWLGIKDVLSKDTPYKRIVIVRSAVPSRNIGFTPGTLEEKIALYEKPYKDIFAFLFGRASTYDDMKQAGLIVFESTSYLRGVTYDDSILFLDEVQNTNDGELHTAMTRVGINTKVVVCGDGVQNDLHHSRGTEQSGFDRFLAIAKLMVDDFHMIEFEEDDIVRSAFVKAWIKASNRVSKRN